MSSAWAVAAPMFFSGRGRGALAALCPVLAGWLVTERLGLPARAVLERDLRFGRSNGALLAVSLALGLVAIPLALAGWGVLAWVVGKVVQSAVTASLLWAFAGMRPPLGWRGGAMRPLLRFGLPLTAADLIQFYNWNVPIVVIGLAMRDNEVLALYWIAYKLTEYMMQLQSLVSTVVYPAFTRALDDRQLVEGFHLVTKYSAALAVLPVGLVLTLGLGVPRLILGEDYLQATRALQIFTALAAFRMTTVHWYHAYLAKGRTAALPLIVGITAVGATAAALLGVHWGRRLGGEVGAVNGVAIGMAVASFVAILIAINVFLRRVLTVRYLPCLALPLAAGAVTLGAGLALRLTGFDQAVASQFWTAVLAMGILYAGLGLALDARALRRLREKML